MRQAAFIVVAVLVLAAPQASAKEPLAPRTILGIAWQQRQTSVVELDARTLQRVSEPAALGKAGAYLARSPGMGYRGAFVVGEGSDAIRFVDLSTMEPEHRVQLPCAIRGPALWEVANRLVVMCSGSASSVLVVDPVRQRLVSRKTLKGDLFRISRSTNGVMVGLLAPLDGIGATRLVVVDGTAFVRSVALPNIRAGTKLLDQETYRMRIEHPALAVDPRGLKAAVIPASGAVALVDLSALSVTPRSVRALAAARKTIEGADRTAVWTWNDTIAVTGTNWIADTTHHSTPAGLTVINTADWTSRMVDPEGVSVSYNGLGGVLLSAGAVWDAATEKSIGHGLTGFGFDGTQRFHTFGNDAIWVAAFAGTYAYVADNAFKNFQIVDTTTGQIIGSPHTAQPTTLASVANY